MKRYEIHETAWNAHHHHSGLQEPLLAGKQRGRLKRSPLPVAVFRQKLLPRTVPRSAEKTNEVPVQHA